MSGKAQGEVVLDHFVAVVKGGSPEEAYLASHTDNGGGEGGWPRGSMASHTEAVQGVGIQSREEVEGAHVMKRPVQWIKNCSVGRRF